MKTDRRYSCFPDATTQDIDGIVLVLSSIQQGAASRQRMPAVGTSPVMQSAMDDMGLWLKVPQPSAGPRGSMSLESQKLLHGQGAALYLFKPEWVETLVRQAKAAIVSHGMLVDDPDKAPGASSSGAASSSSMPSVGTSIVLKGGIVDPKAGNAKRARGDGNGSSMKSKMMKIRCGVK